MKKFVIYFLLFVFNQNISLADCEKEKAERDWYKSLHGGACTTSETVVEVGTGLGASGLIVPGLIAGVCGIIPGIFTSVTNHILIIKERNLKNCLEDYEDQQRKKKEELLEQLADYRANAATHLFAQCASESENYCMELFMQEAEAYIGTFYGREITTELQVEIDGHLNEIMDRYI